MSTVNAIQSATGTTTPTTPPKAKSDIVSQDSFLKLLVARIKNQDPLNPADGTQFLSQLAQFSQLEQLVGMRAEMRSANEPAAKSATKTNG